MPQLKERPEVIDSETEAHLVKRGQSGPEKYQRLKLFFRFPEILKRLDSDYKPSQKANRNGKK